MQAPHVAIAPSPSTEEPQVAETPEFDYLEEDPQRVTSVTVVGDEVTRVFVVRLTLSSAPPKTARNTGAGARREVGEVVFYDKIAIFTLRERSIEQAHTCEVLDVDTYFSQGGPKNAVGGRQASQRLEIESNVLADAIAFSPHGVELAI